jgi:hypothetical protein
MRLFAALTICTLAAWLGIVCHGRVGRAATPPEKPKQSDDTIDWLFSKSATAPSSRPASRPTSAPASPFTEIANPESRRGTLTLNTGQKFSGQIFTTREKPLRLWDEKDKEYRDIPLSAIKSLDAIILWERDEKEWHFKESGSDIKEFTGKTYPARELQYRLTLANGQSLTGGLVAPLYVTSGDKTLTFVLNKRQKGDVGKSLNQLPYIKSVSFDD